MEENKQHFLHIMLYYFKKSKNAIKMQNKICVVYGEGAVTDCQKWLAKFHAGDFLIDDAPQLGRPVEIDSNRDINRKQSMLYHARDNQHTQNIQIKH